MALIRLLVKKIEKTYGSSTVRSSGTTAQMISKDGSTI